MPRFVAVAFDREIRVYEKPINFRVMEPFVQIKKINTGHTENITAIFWSPDSRFICTASKDCNVYMNNVFSLPGYVTQKFVGHRKKVLQVFWDKEMRTVRKSLTRRPTLWVKTV
jgi:WD40 repeat protein